MRSSACSTLTAVARLAALRALFVSDFLFLACDACFRGAFVVAFGVFLFSEDVVGMLWVVLFFLQFMLLT